MSFAHLHVHTEYSLLDGACRIEPMLDKIKAMGQTSVAVTDHGVMYGVLKFYKEAKSRGINPVIGCEVYVAPRTRHDKVHGIDSERYHLILLCENNTGYRNLIKIVSEGWTSGFYVKPRVDRELLEKYHEGIICLSGCLFGEVAQNLLKGDYEEAKKTALWYKSVFGENNYFIEIQTHGLDEQQRIIKDQIKLARELDIPLAATNDAHYIEKEDSVVQEALICIQTNHIMGEDTGMNFGADEFYLKSESEMLSAFPFCPEAVENTAAIAGRCNVEFEFGKTKLPHFEVPGGMDHYEYFRGMCERGLTARYGENPPKEYIDRMNYELNVINTMGYTDYYLIVHDFIDYAKKHGIPVGPGRGSGAASICAYCCGITGIDPMKYNLLFERFLNPERVSMPDFDIDFCFERREEVINYVIGKYGADHVAQIVTFGTMAAKAAVRDIGRVKGVSYQTVDTIAKLIPAELNITIEKALAKSRELKALYDTDPVAREIIDMSIKVEGMPRHASTHAAGVVITADPVDTYVPLSKNDESVVTQFTMKDLESLGLLKMDFLGLRTLTVISGAEKSIRKHTPGFSIDKADIADKNIYEMFSRGETEGVFQFESAGMKRVLTGLCPRSLEDIIAVIALYRPGPMDSIPDYIRNKQKPSAIKYKVPALRNILDVTYGCIVYQEQVMQICREVAGYSFGRADIVRRAMAKKQHDVMLREREYFVNGIKDENGNVICDGALRRGVGEKEANELFDEMMSFASYAFNKAHAAAYAYVSYQTAYLKYYYPKEFFASLMTGFIDNLGKISEYINECSRLGIKILPPHVNTGSVEFTPSQEGIVFSLAAVKNVGSAFISRLVRERETGGEYKDFFDFCTRLYGRDLNRRALESLIKCGAFDGLGQNRHQLLISIDAVMREIDDKKKRDLDGQIGFGDLGSETVTQSTAFTYPDAEEFDPQEKLRNEKEVTGLYLSGNPLDRYSGYLAAVKHDSTADIIVEDGGYRDGRNVTLIGIITGVNKKTTRSNESMAFVTLEDNTGRMECIVFPKSYDKYRGLLFEGNVLLVNARVSENDDAPPSAVMITAEHIEPGDAPEMPAAQAPAAPKADEPARRTEPAAEAPVSKESGNLFLRFPSASSHQINVCRNLLSIFEGKVPVYFYYEDSKKYAGAVRVSVNEVLLRELKKILGDGNVVFKE